MICFMFEYNVNYHFFVRSLRPFLYFYTFVAIRFFSMSVLTFKCVFGSKKPETIVNSVLMLIKLTGLLFMQLNKYEHK